MENFKKIIRECKRIMFGNYKNKSWSQDGEDLVIAGLFDVKNNGCYVDIGAHHPLRFSNTYLFYRRGWTGINVDAMPGSMTLFKLFRPKDINLELGVGQVPGELDYYIFNEPALNSFSKEISDMRHNQKNNYYIKEVKKIKIKTLEQILDDHLISSAIDFLTIDVEGLDLQVLRSNNWEKYRPIRIIVEDLQRNNSPSDCSEIESFLIENGYSKEVYVKRNVIYKDSKSFG